MNYGLLALHHPGYCHIFIHSGKVNSAVFSILLSRRNEWQQRTGCDECLIELQPRLPAPERPISLAKSRLISWRCSLGQLG